MLPLTTHTTYDEVPYQGGIVAGTHPEHLAAVARLFGVLCAPVESCRVLEIGCASATNLLPMAYALPNSTFVGIDPSHRQIEMGRAACAEYGTRNVDLLACDVRDAVSWGREFDYIVCHGVFSWVEADVQDAILESCARLLAPNGVAYISYNTLPGFHVREPIREMMRFHSASIQENAERANQARALLAFLLKSTGKFAGDPSLTAYNQFLSDESSLLASTPDSYILHEHMTEYNKAFYLHEFVGMADTHGLQYLGDSAFHTMLLSGLPQDVADEINAVASNQVALEQYRDFVVNRMFRKTLLCRSDTAVSRNISIEAISSLLFREHLPKRSGDDWNIPKVGGLQVRVTDISVHAVLDTLAQAAPLSLDFSELHRRLNSGSTAIAPEHLGAILLSLYALDAVEFRTWTPPMADTISERPEAFLPARLGAAAKLKASPLPLHGVIELDPFVRSLLPFVDGTRTWAELVDAIGRAIAEGTFEVADVAPQDLPTQDDLQRLALEALEQLRGCGLLLHPPA